MLARREMLATSLGSTAAVAATIAAIQERGNAQQTSGFYCKGHAPNGAQIGDFWVQPNSGGYDVWTNPDGAWLDTTLPSSPGSDYWYGVYGNANGYNFDLGTSCDLGLTSKGMSLVAC